MRGRSFLFVARPNFMFQILSKISSNNQLSNRRGEQERSLTRVLGLANSAEMELGVVRGRLLLIDDGDVGTIFDSNGRGKVFGVGDGDAEDGAAQADFNAQKARSVIGVSETFNKTTT